MTDLYKKTNVIVFLLILITGSLLSIWVFFILQAEETKAAINNIDEVAESRINTLSIRSRSMFIELDSIKAFYEALKHVNKSNFETFLDHTLKGFKEIEVLSWVPMVPFPELDNIITLANEDGYQNYHMQEWDDNHNFIDATHHEFYYPVYHTYGKETGWFPHGFNIGSLPEYLEAMEQSRDTGMIVAVLNNQDIHKDNKEKMVDIILPVYKNNMPLTTINERRQHIHGFITASINIDIFLKNSYYGDNTNYGMDTYIVANDNGINSDLIYFFPSPVRKSPISPESLPLSGAYATDKLNFFNYDWTILQKPVPGYFKNNFNGQWLTLIMSLLFVLILAAYVSDIVRQNQIINLRVKERTSELKQLLEKHDDAMEKLLESEEKNRTILDTVTDGIITINESGTIISFNPGAEKIFGYTAKEIIDKNVNLLMPEPNKSLHDSYIKNYLTTGVAKIIGISREVTGSRKDGTTFPMELTIGKIQMWDKLLFVGTARDITEQKIAEQRIITEREKAEEANNAKSIFLANMSHELRTPLNAIIGYSEMLEDEITNPQILDDIGKISMSGKHLLNMINDILDFSKIESGKVEIFPEAFSINKLLIEIKDAVTPLVKKNKNSFSIKTNPDLDFMQTDRTKLSQILLNLLSNAAKFTENGEIQLVVDAVGEDTNKVIRFAVKDNGIGLNQTQKERLFQPFTQVDSSTYRKYGGSGLGLVISKQFTSLLGGNLDVESNYGVGSTFTVSLPVKLSNVKYPIPVSKEMKEINSDDVPIITVKDPIGTVLVIDDEVTARNLLCSFITKAGWNVIAAEDAMTGIQYARLHRPDVITLDVLMPGIDGWTVLEILRAEAELKSIPIIMCTIVDDINKGFTLGVSDYLVKPITRNRLITVLSKYNKQNLGYLLVVEDDQSIRKLVGHTARKLGWEVVEVENGKKALESIQEKRPGLILLDLLMPEMDGFEVIEALKTETDTECIPIIVMTAKNLTEDDHQRLNGHVKNILKKEQKDINSLLDEISAMLKNLKTANK